MQRPFAIDSIFSVDGPRPRRTVLTKAIDPEHQPYIGTTSAIAFEDLRAAYAPSLLGIEADHSLVARWNTSDNIYRAKTRLCDFWVTRLNEAIVYPPYHIVSVGNTILYETIRQSKALASVLPGYSRDQLELTMRKKEVQVPASIRENVIQVSGDSLLLGHGLYQNYFNWILLYASNIALFQNSRGSTKLVTPKFSKSYVPGTLEFFGVRQDSVYQVERPTLFEQLTVLSPPAWGRYNISPVIIDTLRGHPRVRDLWNRSRNKIYVPRSNTKIRRVINEGELESCLQAQGFSIFDSASHSIFDQIRAFKNASVIVAAHGAGLANIVFCNPGAIIIELVPEGYDQGVTSYRSLADLFGLQYMQVLVPAVGVPPKGNPCNSDIHVPVKELMNILADL